MEHLTPIPDPTPVLSRAGRVTGLACPEPGCPRHWRGLTLTRYLLHWRVTHDTRLAADATPRLEQA